MYRGQVSPASKRGGVRSSANSILQRANAQLRGERVPQTKQENEDDGLGAYLSGLSTAKKEVEHIDWDKLAELSDVSGDEIQTNTGMGTMAPANKFLKKKKNEDLSTNKENNAKSPSSKFTKKPISSSGTPQQSKNYTQKSSALSKAAAYTSKYASKEKKEILRFSESDLDMDFSMDEDVVADVQFSSSKKQSAATKKEFQTNSFKGKSSATTPVTRSFKKPSSPQLSSESEVGFGRNSFMKKKSVGFSKSGDSSVSLDDSTSQSEFGKAGSKFLKKKQPAVEDLSSIQQNEQAKLSTSAPGPRKSQFRLASAERYSTKLELDSDEESMAQYIDGLSHSSSADLPRHSPELRTPRSPGPQRKSPALQSLESVEEIKEEETESTSTADSLSSAGSFKVNLMDLDTLEPVLTVETPRYSSTTSKPKDSKSSKPSSSKDQGKGRNFKETKAKKTSKDEKKAKVETVDLFSSLGLHTVDELLAGPDEAIDEVNSDLEELDIRTELDGIKTEIDDQYDSDFEVPTINTNRSPTPLKSILSQTPREKTPRSGRGRVRLSLGDIIRVRSRSPSPEVISTARGSVSQIYTEEFESEIDTAASIKTEAESDSESISEYTSGSPTYSGRSSPLRRRRLSGHSVSEDYYSDDFTIATEASTRHGRQYSRSSSRESMASSFSEDYTSYTEASDDRSKSRTPSPERPRRRSSNKRNAEVQTTLEPGLAYHWNQQTGGYAMAGPQYGLGFVDPTPIATHVVGADALEAMTAYSPSVLALNDMLRQQLQLTQNFLHMTRHMHQAYIGSMEQSHSYTTLEDTKEYIKKKRKPRLTFKEALKQVKAEMELDT